MENQSLQRIYVLNVKAFTERRAFMQRQLAALELTAEFILDWDVEDLRPEIVARYFTADNTLSAGQKSCALKHIAAMQAIAAGHGPALVLEDDAQLTGNFRLGVQQALTESPRFAAPKVIYIGSGGNFFTPKSQRRPGQHLYVGNRSRFTDSYILDADTARQRLDWIGQHKIGKPIDNQFDEMDRALGITLLWLEDPVVEQGSKNGLFDSSLEPAPPCWLKALLFRWEKLKRKHIYQLWR